MQDLNDKNTGSALTAQEWNQVPSEIQNVIEESGLSLSSIDLNQLGKSISSYIANGNFYTDNGSANGYVLTSIGSKQSPPAYTDGSTFEFITTNPNTPGTSTVNVATLGTIPITLRDGSNPIAGQISDRVVLKFNSVANRCELMQTGSINTKVIKSSGTYSPPKGVKSIEFTIVGGGGGGGGILVETATFAATGGGGGGGGASLISTVDIKNSYNVVIGIGGIGGSAGNNAGGAGGDSSVVISASLDITGTGGKGGGGDVATEGFGNGNSGGAGVGIGGTLNISGSDGDAGIHVASGIASTGSGGCSMFGGRTYGGLNAEGTVASGFGGGGTGASEMTSIVNRSGGDGTKGVLLIREFY